jgi:hypothetical protein
MLLLKKSQCGLRSPTEGVVNVILIHRLVALIACHHEVIPKSPRPTVRAKALGLCLPPIKLLAKEGTDTFVVHVQITLG